MSDYADILNGKLSSGDAANLVEKLQSDLAASRAEVEKLKEALQEIRDKKGKVCAEYETCEHPACASSYESWALAHRVLDLTPSPSVRLGLEAPHTPDEQECIYCKAMIPIADAGALPPDSPEWDQIAEQHGTGCEWIETRAYQIAKAESQ